MTATATNVWNPTAPCGGAMITALNMPIMEACTVIALNTVGPLSQTPDMALMMVIVNGRVFLPIGSLAAFTVSGAQITWTSNVFSFAPGDDVNAIYTYTEV